MTTETTDDPVTTDGWTYFSGTIRGEDACRIEGYARCAGADTTDLLMMFAEDPGVKRSDMTRSQATANIIKRCQRAGITVEPGEIAIDAEGNWTFRGWRLSKGEPDR